MYVLTHVFTHLMRIFSLDASSSAIFCSANLPIFDLDNCRPMPRRLSETFRDLRLADLPECQWENGGVNGCVSIWESGCGRVTEEVNGRERKRRCARGVKCVYD